MKKGDHFLMGALLKTSGIKGELVLKLNNDCPEEIKKLESIFICIDKKLVPFFIEEITPKSTSSVLVKLEGLDTEEQSSEFIGCEFYISPQQVEDINLNKEEYIDVVGYKVFNQDKKFIGTVTEFIDIPENPLLNVNVEDRDVLIPAKDELIIEVDDDLKEILLIVPEGLMDI